MKKSLGILLALTLVVSTMVGCGNKKVTPEETNKVETKTEGKTETKKINYQQVYRTTGGKIKTLNQHIYKTTAESDVMLYIYSGLLDIVVNQKGDGWEIIPAQAKEKPTKSADGKTWTFKIRDGLKWNDGTVIDAETYVYSYKMLLDPKLKNYRADAFMSDIVVAGAQDYFEGKGDWSKVLIKAPDKNTLEITLDFPVNDMDFLMSFVGGGVTSPVNQKLYEAGMNADKTETTYGTSFETSATCGPYIIKEWVRDQNFVYEKDKNSPMASIYTPDIVKSRVVEDAGTNLQMFEKGEIDEVGLSGANLAKYLEDPRLCYTDSTSIWSMFINSETTTNPVLKDVNFRKALFYAVDRDKIVKNVVKSGKPAPYFLSTVFATTSGQSYRKSSEAIAMTPKNNGFDEKIAKDYFAKAYAANGNKLITVEMQYFDTSQNMKKMSELLEEQIENIFGKDKLDVQLKATPWQTVYDNMEQGKCDIGFGAWSGSPFNPWSFMNVYTSKYGSKIDKLKNAEFDKLYERTTKGDLLFKNKEKHDALVQMEKILYDETQFVPIYESQAAVMYSDRVKLTTGGKYIPGVGLGVMQAEFAELAN